MSDTALAYARAHRDAYLNDLIALLSIPSVSAQPAHNDDIRRAAEWLRAHFSVLGLQAQIMETGGHPVVYAEWLKAGPSRPTILVYGHYDVQPAEPLELWTTPPYTPTVRDGFLYARGSTDNKGQHMAHVKAIESFLKADGALPCNVKFLIEGEEEIGGPNLTGFIEKHTGLLACDAVMVSDSALLDLQHPALVYGLRGLSALEVEVRCLARDVHSGSYGGNVQNPAVALAQIIASLKDVQGRVTVPGFYNRVRVLSPEERAALARTPHTEGTLIEESGALQAFGDPEFTIAERHGARPTLEINGMWSGYTGPGTKTIIPATAHCKITCRLIPDQDPHEVWNAVATAIRAATPPGCSLTLSGEHGAPGTLIDRDSPFMRAAAAAAQATYGNEPVFELEGGSIPVVRDFQMLLGKPVVLLGLGLNTDNAHSPDEKFALECYEKGVEASIRFFAGV